MVSRANDVRFLINTSMISRDIGRWGVLLNASGNQLDGIYQNTREATYVTKRHYEDFCL